MIHLTVYFPSLPDGLLVYSTLPNQKFDEETLHII